MASGHVREGTAEVVLSELQAVGTGVGGLQRGAGRPFRAEAKSQRRSQVRDIAGVHSHDPGERPQLERCSQPTRLDFADVRHAILQAGSNIKALDNVNADDSS